MDVLDSRSRQLGQLAHVAVGISPDIFQLIIA